jgi:hypothetical protein
MRPYALSLALVASAQLVLATTPAWAQGPEPAPPPLPTTAPEPPPPPPPVPAAPTATAAPAATPGADGLVEVRIENKGKAIRLEHRSAPNAPWEPACEDQCKTRVPVADEYRVVGTGINESKVFHLNASQGDHVELRVITGESSKERIGKYVLIGGGALIVAGILTMAIGCHPGDTFTLDGTTNQTNFDVLTVGTSLVLAGVVGGLYGGATWYNNTQSHVGGDVMGAAPTRGSIPAPEQTAMRPSMPGIQAYQIPIFRTTF